MSKRFEDMMTELMHDVFEAQVNPQPILEVAAADETLEAPETDKAPKYDITFPSKTSGTKTYNKDKLSSSRARNFQMLGMASLNYAETSDAALRAAIREMIDAILDAL